MQKGLILDKLYEWIVLRFCITTRYWFLNNVKSFWVYRSQSFGIYLLPEYIIWVLAILKNSIITQCKQLTDLVAIDTPQSKFRLQVNYILSSFKFSSRIILTVKGGELYEISSVISEHKSAIASEREAWDVMGIYFKNHQKLRRVLNDYGFKGHSLRKSYPLTGFEEIVYSNSWHLIQYPIINLSQEYRTHM